MRLGEWRLQRLEWIDGYNAIILVCYLVYDSVYYIAHASPWTARAKAKAKELARLINAMQ